MWHNGIEMEAKNRGLSSRAMECIGKAEVVNSVRPGSKHTKLADQSGTVEIAAGINVSPLG